MRHRFVASVLATFVLVLAAFTGTSLAGNGHGNGGGSTNGNSQASQPAPAAQTHSQATAHTTKSTTHAAKSKQSSTSPSSPATGGSNANGVKPSNSTKHDTYATASSDQTKKYGNGKTAGQIATAAGSGNATLHGPGNSQPHKTSCGGHEVDVHALPHGGKCGTATSTPAVVHAAQGHENQSSKGEEQSSSKSESKTESQTQGVSASAEQHVTICHATGSATNPFVRISPSASGVFHGHLGHQDGRDIVPLFTWQGQTLSENWDATGQAIWNNGCNAVAASTSAASAAQATVTPSVQTAPSTQSSTSVVQGAQLAPVTATGVGAVKGATVTLKPKSNRVAAAATTKPKPAGGVLGATTRLGSTVTSTKLPFTGLPLWIFVAVAAALILTGAAVRRSGHERI